MSLTTIMLILIGVIILNLLILFFSTLAMRSLRTVPKPEKWNLETMMLASAEMRAGKQLQQACYNNDPQAASIALTHWAWASGEIAVANSLDRKMTAIVQPGFRDTIDELWGHLDSPRENRWFGGRLWNAFVEVHPEFDEQKQSMLS